MSIIDLGKTISYSRTYNTAEWNAWEPQR
jgi:hypothetical protein